MARYRKSHKTKDVIFSYRLDFFVLTSARRSCVMCVYHITILQASPVMYTHILPYFELPVLLVGLLAD